ncbi:unnamed protein product [Linum tenue]|uniref:TIR domain-containing protein n=1 Tax=Linum tenue TaxID=586396 RepID=A0AAV0RNF7_9ROSI|nr:unnamed protein product [Linum tenue]
MSTLFLHLLFFALQLLLFITLLLLPSLRRRFTTAAPPPTAASTSPPSTAPSSSPLHPNYDAFISFRGDDVRDTFLSHLHNHLSHHKKILAYMDDADLARGQSISPSLSAAIERSTVYIVILSPNYAGSRWCLDELVMVLECREGYGRKVVPVFYGGVSPGDVGSYGKKKLPRETEEEKVRVWRAALTKVAQISGFDSRVIRPETRLIEEISRVVLEGMHNRTPPPPTTMASHFNNTWFIGVNERMMQIRQLLCLEAHDNRTVGLWGMGGIGKTKLARAIFDTFSCQFEASEFIENFTQQLIGSQVFDLQDKLFSRLLGDDSNTYRTHAHAKLDRLRRVRVLIVIDDIGNDVGNIGPLEDLLTRQTCDMFGPGSRIILTSRNKQLLANLCNHIYEVKGLNDIEALQLFYLHAFKKDSSSSLLSGSYVEMSWMAANYAGGNPLALKILGSHLCGRDEEFWARELGALMRNHSNRVVENVLRKSYDGLSQVEKNVFLDIACFYPTWSRDTLGYFEEKVIDGCYEEYGGGMNLVTNLIDKSLVSVEGNNEYSFIAMHKLLQSFGQRMVNGESRVWKRSRLWEAKDIYYLLRQNKGTEAVEGIVWNVSNLTYEVKDIQIVGDAFERMENLRMLVICYSGSEAVLRRRKLIVPESGLTCLPDSLKCLDWESFPSKSLPPNFSPQNLVTLELVNSDIQQLWDGNTRYLELGNLKSLNLGGCIYLKKLPNVCTAKKLERLDLSYCQSLLELPPSILYLPKLKEILLWYCISLELNNLEDHLNDVDDDDHDIETVLPSLQTLSLSGTRIKKIPDFLCRLQILQLGCNECSMMTEFPVIPSLEGLRLGKTLIKEVDFLLKLKELFFTSNDQLTHLSTEICKLKCVERINLSKCIRLEEFPEILEAMESLVEVDLSGCINLRWIPDSISNIVHLEMLDLSGTSVEYLPYAIGDLTFLKILILDGCTRLARLHSICLLYSLTWLDVSNCGELRHLPFLPWNLKRLNAYNCKSLETISYAGEHDLVRSQWRLGNCPNLDIDVSIRLLYKFIRDVVNPVPRYDLHCPLLIVPEESVGWAECMVGGETSSGGSVMVDLYHPWKLKGVICWALLDSSSFVTVNKALYNLECSWSMIDDDDGEEEDEEDRGHDDERRHFSSCLVRRDVTRCEQLGGVFLWYDSRNMCKYQAMEEGNVRINFSLCAAEMVGDYCSWREVELQDFMIKSCGIKLVYDEEDDDEEEEEEEDDDDDDDEGEEEEDDENDDEEEDDDEKEDESKKKSSI